METKHKRNAYFTSQLRTRAAPPGEADGEKRYIEGYFALFNRETELMPGWFEQIAPGAFAKSLRENDLRCLFNHENGFVLGRQSARTFEAWEDETGLFGRVEINPADQAAMDVYARVARGDISGCSFGFCPIMEDYDVRSNGTMHVTVREADTFEVSICTFPAYPDTEVEARRRDWEQSQTERAAVRRAALKQKLEGIKWR